MICLSSLVSELWVIEFCAIYIDFSANHNIKTMEKENLQKLIILKQKVIDI